MRVPDHDGATAAPPASDLHRLGMSAFESGSLDEAAHHLVAAVRATVDPELLNDLGLVLDALGRRAEAQAAVRTALVIDPDNAAAAENLSAFHDASRPAAAERRPARHASTAVPLLLPTGTTPPRLHVGCGDMRLDGFVNIDVRATPATDIVADLNRVDLGDSVAACAFSNAFFEHLFRDDRRAHLESIRRALRPDGFACYVGIPYFRNVARAYLDGAPGIVGSRFDLFNVYRYTHGNPEQEDWYFEQLHKSLFDEDELAVLLTEAGFASFALFSYVYPGEEIAVTMGFYAAAEPLDEVQLKAHCLSFLGQFDGRLARVDTLRFLDACHTGTC